MMCVMHECVPYGYLCVNGKPMTNEQLSRLVGETTKSVVKSMAELENAAVFSRDDQGRIYSRRMVKDEHLRNVRAEAGAKGGNPALLGDKVKQKVNQKDNHEPNQDDNQSPTPSSSSSSSSSTTTPKAERATRLPAEWVLPDEWLEWAITDRGWTQAMAHSVACQFKDHWISEAGPRSRKLDWFATWRKWCRNERCAPSTQTFGKTSQGIALLEQMKG